MVLYNAALAETFGLQAADHKAFDLLLRAGPLTAGELGRATGLTTGAVTGLIDRLESSGFVDREPDPADRRKVLVVARPTAITSDIARRMKPLVRELRAVYDPYRAGELALLLDFVSRWCTTLSSLTWRLGDRSAAG
ncbi:MAG TPA: MarR family transcriptional regulator [Kofleriaceae bacterium]|jgi:DNA-binding MarR family transcriptional regulator